jgi:hypothetical protein
MKNRWMFLVLFISGVFLAPDMAVGQGIETTYFPQWVTGPEAGGSDQIYLIMQNNSSSSQEIGVDWYDQGGSYQLQATNPNTLPFCFKVNINPNEKWVRVLSSADGMTRVGSAIITQPIDSLGQPLTSVSMVMQRVMPDGKVVDISWEIFPVKAATHVAPYGDSQNTGFAIYNPGLTTVVITLTRVKNGMAAVLPALAPGGHTALFLGQTALGNFSGSELVEFTPNFPVAVMLLRMAKDPKDGQVKYKSFPISTTGEENN